MTRAARLAAGALTALLLCGCNSAGSLMTGSGSVRDLIHTATGAINEIGHKAAEAVELGKQGIDTAKKTYDSTMSRGAQIKDGIDKIKEGSSQVKDALQ
jgi:hypothetical protein